MGYRRTAKVSLFMQENIHPSVAESQHVGCPTLLGCYINFFVSLSVGIGRSACHSFTCVVWFSFLGGREQFKATSLEYMVVKLGKKNSKNKSKPVPCTEMLFLCMGSCVICYLSLHVPSYSLLSPGYFVCLWCPWLTKLAVPSYFAGGDRLSYCYRFPHYRTQLVTNTDSSPADGPKSQLEKTEIQLLKLPSEDYPNFLQLSPSPLSVSATHHPLFPTWLNHGPLAAARTAVVLFGAILSQSNMAICQGLVGHHATEQTLADVNFIHLFLFHSCT